jgi:hypothetical protein
MYTTKSGKKFGSAFVGKKHDEMHAEPAAEKNPKMPAAHEAAEKPQFEAGEQEGVREGQEGQGEGPEQVVAQHGKATTVHVKHDHVAKKHHVTSTHEDGHTHESDHASAKEAHDAAYKLGGSEEAGEPGAESEDEGAPEPDGFHMPRLA